MRYLTELTYFTPRLAEMISFYQKVLETEPISQSEGMAIFQTGTMKLYLHARYEPSGDDLEPVDHLAVAAPDVDKACQALEQQGIAIKIAPKDYYWGRSAYLQDPDGHQVEVEQSEVDWIGAHRYFAAACFNQAWDYLDKSERTPAEDEMLISLVHASIWHWSQRPDCTDTNRSIGYWQVSRVYAILGQADNARRFGQICLEVTPADLPFFLGYAYEALARAEWVAGNHELAARYLDRAREQAAGVPDPEDRKVLEDDLNTIKTI
jgi:catechol 2,3-dioxygenase-like lactoylglutathione lyase family enzyme